MATIHLILMLIFMLVSNVFLDIPLNNNREQMLESLDDEQVKIIIFKIYFYLINYVVDFTTQSIISKIFCIIFVHFLNAIRPELLQYYIILG